MAARAPPSGLAFAVAARLRGKRVVLGVRQDFPSHMRTRHPRRYDIRGAAMVLEGDLARAGAPASRWWPWGRTSPGAIGGGEVLPIVISLVDEEHVTTREEALARSYDGDLTLLSVGRLDPEKNPLLLADVLARLREQEPRWRLVVCGDGTMRQELEDRVRESGNEDHADFLGYLSLDSGLRDHYRDSHMFLHVSWTEGVPQVLFESFAAGLPGGGHGGGRGAGAGGGPLGADPARRRWMPRWMRAAGWRPIPLCARSWWTPGSSA